MAKERADFFRPASPGFPDVRTGFDDETLPRLTFRFPATATSSSRDGDGAGNLRATEPTGDLAAGICPPANAASVHRESRQQ